jgi:hypothetical protein
MSHKSQTRSRLGLPATWLELNITVGTALLTVTFLIGTVAILAAGIGSSKPVALCMLAGVVAALAGVAFLRLSEHLRTDGLTIPENTGLHKLLCFNREE